MKPIYQRTGALSGQNGDCFQACVASLFNCRLDDVPNFYRGIENGKLLPKEVDQRMQQWLRPRGCGGFVEFGFIKPIEYVLQEMTDRMPYGYYLLTGRASRDQVHVVVCRGGMVVHDPATSPGHHTIKGPSLDGFFRVGLFVMAS